MTWFTRGCKGRSGAGDCAACAVRDNTIAIQRAQLTELRYSLSREHAAHQQLAAGRDAMAWDAVSNLYALFTLHLIEHAAQHDPEYVGELPNRVRDFALMFMADCAGLHLNSRVAISHQAGDDAAPVRLVGRVRDVRLDRDGEPVLLVAMDNGGDTEKLVAGGYDLAVVEPSGVLAGLLMVVVPFPARRASIGDGGWIEATS
ncbi:hypothetical protein FB561_2770 [Kribbella amoyensis]|uniref:Uncharacterized protein n=1 Tax=Kribbella amoyensis TaxID=996641 RepID=A0A561BRX2_9ACTN|nr:hypothetical protein [Kribbella amoyensis]TWD81650.1 hypothetical protein FB561_2770 [Kribbella amoyensis]